MTYQQTVPVGFSDQLVDLCVFFILTVYAVLRDSTGERVCGCGGKATSMRALYWYVYPAHMLVFGAPCGDQWGLPKVVVSYGMGNELKKLWYATETPDGVVGMAFLCI